LDFIDDLGLSKLFQRVGAEHLNRLVQFVHMRQVGHVLQQQVRFSLQACLDLAKHLPVFLFLLVLSQQTLNQL
jgi:hypothetical protein